MKKYIKCFSLSGRLIAVSISRIVSFFDLYVPVIHCRQEDKLPRSFFINPGEMLPKYFFRIKKIPEQVGFVTVVRSNAIATGYINE